MGVSSSSPRESIMLMTRSVPNRRIRSSSRAQVEAALAGVALTAGTAAQLIVNPPGLVALGADDEQAAGRADLLGLLGRSRPCTFSAALS